LTEKEQDAVDGVNLMDIEAWSGPFERAIELEDELAWHVMAWKGYHCIICFGAFLYIG